MSFNSLMLELDSSIAEADGENNIKVDPRVAEACGIIILATCQGLRGVATDDLKTAVFIDDDGGVSFVSQSLATNRRLEYKIPPSANLVKTCVISEKGNLTWGDKKLSDLDLFRANAKWLTARKKVK